MSGASLEEAQFHESWTREIECLDDPLAHPLTRGLTLALAGGRLANGFASVFLAGYQAALRAIFADCQFSGWAAFVVSEEHGTDARPGVTYEVAKDRWYLTGHKSWVAGSRYVEVLVTKAGRGAEAKYFAVPLASSGLELDHKAAPRVLPDLSQAGARFDQVPVDDPLDARDVAYFGAAEVFFIYAAFVAWVGAQPQDEAFHEEAQNIVTRLRELEQAHTQPVATSQGQLESSAPLACLDRKSADLVALDAQVQSLRQGLAQRPREEDALWQRDQQLIAMYALTDSPAK